MMSPDIGRSPVGSEIQKPVTAGVLGGREWGGGKCGEVVNVGMSKGRQPGSTVARS